MSTTAQFNPRNFYIGQPVIVTQTYSYCERNTPLVAMKDDDKCVGRPGYRITDTRIVTGRTPCYAIQNGGGERWERNIFPEFCLQPVPHAECPLAVIYGPEVRNVSEPLARRLAEALLPEHAEHVEAFVNRLTGSTRGNLRRVGFRPRKSMKFHLQFRSCTGKYTGVDAIGLGGIFDPGASSSYRVTLGHEKEIQVFFFESVMDIENFIYAYNQAYPKQTEIKKEENTMPKSIHEQICEEMNLQPGDRVKVLRRAKDLELGWDNSWNETEMDKEIGKTLTVKYVSARAGVALEGSMCLFPAFVLEIIVSRKLRYPELPFSSIGGYPLELKPESKSIKVGCTEVTFEKIHQLYRYGRENGFV